MFDSVWSQITNCNPVVSFELISPQIRLYQGLALLYMEKLMAKLPKKAVYSLSLVTVNGVDINREAALFRRSRGFESS